MANSQPDSSSQQSIAAGTTGTGAGSALDNGGSKATHTATVTVSAGTFTSGTIVIQLSQDGTNWWSSAATPSPAFATSTVSTISQTGVAAQYVRANITGAIVGGATVGVTVASA